MPRGFAADSLRGERRLVGAVGLVLGAIALLQTAWSVGVVLAPEQVDAIEGVVYYQAGRIARGEPLYQPLDRPTCKATGIPARWSRRSATARSACSS